MVIKGSNYFHCKSNVKKFNMKKMDLIGEKLIRQLNLFLLKYIWVLIGNLLKVYLMVDLLF